MSNSGISLLGFRATGSNITLFVEDEEMQNKGATVAEKKATTFPWAARNHHENLQGTGFVKCAECPGASPLDYSKSGDGVTPMMFCGRGGGYVREVQAESCTGRRPISLTQVSER